MAGKRPDFSVRTVVATNGQRDRWREIGAAFRHEESGNITVLLDALPLGGKLVLMPPKEQRTSRKSSR